MLLEVSGLCLTELLKAVFTRPVSSVSVVPPICFGKRSCEESGNRFNCSTLLFNQELYQCFLFVGDVFWVCVFLFCVPRIE